MATAHDIDETTTVDPATDADGGLHEQLRPWRIGRLTRFEYRVSLELGQRLVVIWHVIAAAASILALFAILNPSGDEGLPGAIKLLLLVVNGLAIFGHAYSAVGIRNVWRHARTVSLITNYLMFVVAAAAALHQFGFFLGIGAFGEGLNKAFVPFMIVLVGVLWIAFARTMIERAPRSVSPLSGCATRSRPGGGRRDLVRHQGRSRAACSLRSVTGLTTPLTFATLLVAIGCGLAVAHMWNARVAAHFGTTYAETQTLSGLGISVAEHHRLPVLLRRPARVLVLCVLLRLVDDEHDEGLHLSRQLHPSSLARLLVRLRSGAGTEVLKDGYQVLAHLDWFGQNWVIGARDIEFWLSLRNIFFFLVLSVPLSVLPALGLSTVLASKLPGMKVFRAIYFVPSVAGVIGVSIVWGQLFQSTVGWINYIILRTGEILPFVDPPAEGQAWLSDRSTALLAIVVVFGWMNFGFNTVLYLAGHQGIGQQLYEAAEIDGASTWKTFRRITVPQLRNTTFYVVSLTSIMALQLFDIVWVLSTPTPGGPDNATTTPVLTLYEEAFVNNSTGYASALAWILFVLIFGLTFGQFRRQRSESIGS